MRFGRGAVGIAWLALFAVASPPQLAYAELSEKSFRETIDGLPVQVYVGFDDGKGKRLSWSALTLPAYPGPGQSIPEMAARDGLATAVNANFYAEDEPGRQLPIGLVVHDSRIRALPRASYPSVGVVEGGLVWDKVRLSAQAYIEGRAPQDVRLLMGPSSKLKNAIYLEGTGPKVGGHVYGVRPAAESQWAVQWIRGRAPQATQRLGVHVRLQGERYGERWQRVTEAVSGSHALAPTESFPSTRREWARARQPRTLIGADAKGRGFVAVFDGRREDSRGVSIDSAWSFVQHRLGAAWALNMDGGGSSTLVQEGRLRNKPSDGYPRPVAVGFGAR